MIAELQLNEIPLVAVVWDYRYTYDPSDHDKQVRDGVRLLAFVHPDVDHDRLSHLPLGEALSLNIVYGLLLEVPDGLGLAEPPTYVATVTDPKSGRELRFYDFELRRVAVSSFLLRAERR